MGKAARSDQGHTEKKREPKFWKSALFCGGEPRFFLHNHVYKNKSSTPEKRAVFQYGSQGEPFSKNRLETVLFLKKESCYGSPRELSPDKKVENGAVLEKRAIFKMTPFHWKEDYFGSLGEPDWIGCSLLTWRAKSDLFLLWNSSPIKGGTKMELHRELSSGQPNGSPRKAISALFLFSVHPWIRGKSRIIPSKLREYNHNWNKHIKTSIIKYNSYYFPFLLVRNNTIFDTIYEW